MPGLCWHIGVFGPTVVACGRGSVWGIFLLRLEFEIGTVRDVIFQTTNIYELFLINSLVSDVPNFTGIFSIK